ncbi:hypothetical protein DL770_005385 [Monosporascus sp. CRB-9-2]|nr:hypothetical protein DL770_005385 [Monosporascus sp. CRB-9-2]
MSMNDLKSDSPAEMAQMTTLERLEQRLARLEALVEALSLEHTDGIPGIKPVRSNQEPPSNSLEAQILMPHHEHKGVEARSCGTSPRNPAFLFRKVEDTENPKNGATSELEIKDLDLILLLDEVIGRYPGVNFKASLVIISSPFAVLVHNWQKLVERAQKVPDAQPCKNLTNLLAAVKAIPELEDYFKIRDADPKFRTVTFETLWTLFAPETLVAARPFMNIPQVFRVIDTIRLSRRFFRIRAWHWDWDGKALIRVKYDLDIERFVGTRRVDELPYQPLADCSQAEAMCNTIRGRSLRFIEQTFWCKPGVSQLFQYHGRAYVHRRQKIFPTDTNEINVKGYGISDAEAFLQFGNGRPLLGGLLGHPLSQSEELQSSFEDTIEFEDTVMMLDRNKGPDPNNDNFLLLPPRILGYATQEKVWAQFLIDSVKPGGGKLPQKFRDILQLDETYKGLIESLVMSFSRDSDKQVADVVEGKGRGLCILLHGEQSFFRLQLYSLQRTSLICGCVGPPGVGKTLTAETIAEATGRPLFVVSVAEIGLNPSQAEQNFERLYSLATKWEAVLLLDDADVLFEGRSIGSSAGRNALVAIFLRVLEYFQGILIVTTNRIETFDVAFVSRMSLTVGYANLAPEQCKAIFKVAADQTEDLLNGWTARSAWSVCMRRAVSAFALSRILQSPNPQPHPSVSRKLGITQGQRRVCSVAAFKTAMAGSLLVVFAIGIILERGSASSVTDFSNDLATDLGPLLQLFGGPITTQYLSEATTFLDYFIFAMAPLGILTAIVSVIRVCGDSSLRAFIGRAQEGDGEVEAELCTSTSRDVCELFNKGGVTRVLGRPKILEVIQVDGGSGALDQSNDDNEHDSDCDSDSDIAGDSSSRVDMGIFLFRDHLQRLPKDGEWEELEPRGLRIFSSAKQGSLEEANSNPSLALENSAKNPFAANPNLSLNVGIVKLPDSVFYLVAVLGLVLQAGVLAMAGLVSWKYGWTKDDDTGSANSTQATTTTTVISDNPSALVFICGSVFMCLGMFLCAALIGQSTREYTYQRKQGQGQASVPTTRLFWLQPGEQVIGDQTFDAFAYSEDGRKHLKQYISSKKDLSKRAELYTWVTIIVTLGGYVAQFIGLRGMNAYVSIAQLGATLLMSFLRGCLRMQRLTRGDNKLANIPDKILRHELDWLAFEIGAKDLASSNCRKGAVEQSEWFWYPCEAARYSLDTNEASSSALPEKLFRYRRRISMLTGHTGRYAKLRDKSFQLWDDHEVKVRTMAQRLRQAIEGTANALFGDKLPNGANSVSVSIPIRLTNGFRGSTTFTGHIKLSLRRNPDPSVSDGVLWTTDSAALEAILGLWLWSLVNGQHLEQDDEHGNKVSVADKMSTFRIIGDDQGTQLEALDMWLGVSHRLSTETVILDVRKLHSLQSFSVWQVKGELDDHLILTPWEASTSNQCKVDIARPLRHIFGWAAIDGSNWSNLESGSETRRIPVRGISTSHSLLNHCSHELFSSFVYTLCESLSPNIGEVSVTAVDGRLRWHNATISSIVTRFKELDLGTSADALICLLPTLRKQLSPPEGELLIPSLLSLSAEYRQRNEWEEAERILHVACIKYRQPERLEGRKLVDVLRKQRISFESSLIALGEHYRWALVRSNADRRLFAYQGVAKMLSVFGPGVGKIQSILKRYLDITSLAALDHNEVTLFPMFQTPNSHTKMWPVLRAWIEESDRLTGDPDYVEDEVFERIADENSTERVNECDGGQDSDVEQESIERSIPRGPVGAEIPNRPRGESYEPSPSGELALKRDGVPLRSGTARSVDGSRTAMLNLLRVMTREKILEHPWSSSIAYATTMGWVEVVAALLELKVNLNHATESGRTALHYAAGQGNYTIAKILLYHGALPNERDKAGRTPLLLATTVLAEDIVSLLLSSGISPSIQAKDHKTPLIVASSLGNVAIVEKLAQYGALEKSSLVDKAGRSALWYAAKGGNTRIVNILIEHAGKELDSADRSGLTPLAVAGWGGHENIILRNGETEESTVGGALENTASPASAIGLTIAYNREDMFDLILEGDRPWWTDFDHPLAIAASYGRLSMAQKLLTKGNIDPNSGSPLAYGAARGHVNVVAALLKDPRTNIAQGEPLKKAILRRSKPVIQVLLEDGRYHPEHDDIEAAFCSQHFGIAWSLLQNAKDPSMVFPKYNNGNALHVAALYGKPGFAQAVLGLQNVNPNIHDAKGQTPLSIAFSQGSLDVAAILLGDARLDLKDNNITGCTFSPLKDLQNSPRGTILHFVMAFEYDLAQAALKLLLANTRLDPNAVDKAGRTPTAFLLEADVSRHRIYGSLQLLLHKRADILDLAEATSDGRTVLHLAAESGLGLDQLLAIETADPNICDSKGQTPLHAAAIRGTHSAIDALLRDTRTDASIVNLDGKTAFDLLDINTYGTAAMVFFADGRCNQWISQGGTTALHIAARHWNGKPKFYLRMLLESGRIEPNQRDIKGRTALWIAASNGRVRALNALLECPSVDPNLALFEERPTVLHLVTESGIRTSRGQKMLASLFANTNLDPNRRNKDSQTALHAHICDHAPDEVHVGTVKAFVDDARTDINAQDSAGRTALHLAARLKAGLSAWEQRLHMGRVIRALLDNERTNGALKDLNGQTAFHIVVSDGSGARELPALMKYFLALRLFSPNTPDPEGRTALHLAASLQLDKEPALRVIRGIKILLKDSRLDPTRLDNKRQTPIHAAVTANFAAAVKLLLDDGRVDLNAQDNMGDTALHRAVTLGRKEIVQLLLRDPRLNRRLVNGSGETALMTARRIEVGVAELTWLIRSAGPSDRVGPRPGEELDGEVSSSGSVDLGWESSVDESESSASESESTSEECE